MDYVDACSWWKTPAAARSASFGYLLARSKTMAFPPSL